MLDSLGNPSMFHNTQTLTIPLPQIPQIPHIDVTKNRYICHFWWKWVFFEFQNLVLSLCKLCIAGIQRKLLEKGVTFVHQWTLPSQSPLIYVHCLVVWSRTFYISRKQITLVIGMFTDFWLILSLLPLNILCYDTLCQKINLACMCTVWSRIV